MLCKTARRLSLHQASNKISKAARSQKRAFPSEARESKNLWNSSELHLRYSFLQFYFHGPFSKRRNAMHVIRFTGKCLRVNQDAGKTLGQEVPLYDPGYDAKSLVVLEDISKTTWRVFNMNNQLCKEPFYGTYYDSN
jgi:hypothetical protein